MKHCINMSTFGGVKPRETGGGSTSGGMEHSLVEPRMNGAYVSNRYGMTTKGLRKKKVASKRKTKRGPKSKTGKETELVEPASTQLGIKKYFSFDARPEAIWIPMGDEMTGKNAT